ncbi:MAG: hypothetical protein ACI9FB_003299 [Candidatus Azotimanducaceae bacterium]|jgi:hypothetical protein
MPIDTYTRLGFKIVIFVSWDCIKYRHKVGEPPQFWQTDWREKFWRIVSILTVREKGGLFYLYLAA